MLLSVRFAVGVTVVHVLTVRARMRKTFQTLATLKRFLATVQTFVLSQVVFVLERLRTLVALVRTLTWRKGERL